MSLFEEATKMKEQVINDDYPKFKEMIVGGIKNAISERKIYAEISTTHLVNVSTLYHCLRQDSDLTGFKFYLNLVEQKINVCW